MFVGALQDFTGSFTPLNFLDSSLMIFGGLVLLFHKHIIKLLCKSRNPQSEPDPGVETTFNTPTVAVVDLEDNTSASDNHCNGTDNK